MNKPLTETREIYQGNGVHGPMLQDEHGQIITNDGMNTFMFAKQDDRDVLVLDGPARKHTGVPAVCLTLAKMRGPEE